MQPCGNKAKWLQIAVNYDRSLSRWSYKKPFYTLAATLLAIQALLLVGSYSFYMSSQGLSTLDSSFAYTSQVALRFYASLSQHSLLIIRIVHFIDLFFALTYFLFLSVLIKKVFFPLKLKSTVYFAVLSLPLLTAVFDLCETLSFVVMSLLPQQNILVTTQIASWCTPLKWIFALLVFFALLGGTTAGLAKALRQKY